MMKVPQLGTIFINQITLELAASSFATILTSDKEQ